MCLSATHVSPNELSRPVWSYALTNRRTDGDSRNSWFAPLRRVDTPDPATGIHH